MAIRDNSLKKTINLDEGNYACTQTQKAASSVLFKIY